MSGPALGPRFAAVSDIHGNLPALDAVLADIARDGVTQIVNLGDILSGPLWPVETAARLMPLRLPTLAGNHERQLLTLPLARQSASDAHASRRLGDAERAWLHGLPAALQLGGDVHCCHGTPTSDLHYLLQTVVPDFVPPSRPGWRAASADEVAGRIVALPGTCRLLLCGHSHVPSALQLPDGGPLVVNPGSVGLQAYDDDQPHPHWIATGSPHARWALLERAADGRWRAELRRTAYDAESAARQADANGRGDWADALRTGRVGRTEAQALGRAG